MLLNNQWIAEEIREEVKKYQETDENESMMIQNLWDTAKAVLKGKFIAIQSYLRKQEKSKRKKNKQTKVSRMKEIIKIRAEINEIAMKKIEKINETVSWFFEKINKIDKTLARLIKKKREGSNQYN